MAIRAGLDLAKVIPWLGALILATLAWYIARAIAAPFNISLPLIGRPFAGIADAIESYIVEPLDDLRKKSEAEIAHGLSDLVDQLAVVLGLFLVLGLVVKAALGYLWNHALRPLIHSITDEIRTLASSALAKVIRLTAVVAEDLAHAESYARDQAADALDSAKAWGRTEIAAALATALRYADDAVGKLRAAEDAAVDNAVKLAGEARAAGAAAAAAVLARAEGEIDAARNAAEAFAVREAGDVEAIAAHALAASEALAAEALGQVKAIAVTGGADLTDFEAYIKSLGLPALIAGSAALATLVTVVLTETGLENQSCRGKVKQVCQTDPSAWANLLGGLAAIGFAFNLKDLYGVAEGLVGDLSGVIQQAA